MGNLDDDRAHAATERPREALALEIGRAVLLCLISEKDLANQSFATSDESIMSALTRLADSNNASHQIGYFIHCVNNSLNDTVVADVYKSILRKFSNHGQTAMLNSYCSTFAASDYADSLKRSRFSASESSQGNEHSDDRLALLKAAANQVAGESERPQQQDAIVRTAALEMLGGEATLGRTIHSQEDLVEAIAAGFPSDVLPKLRAAGYSSAVLEQVVAPRRTLMRRKSERQRLTRAESDGAWRLVYVLALASRVFDGRKAALAWLGRPKGALRSRTPIDLMETSTGTAYVEHILRSLDWGEVA